MTTQDFTRDIDAVICYNDGYWFFKGNKCLKTNMAGDKLMGGEVDITSGDAWPALAGTTFERDLDGVAYSSYSGNFWFIKGDLCIATNKDGNQIVAPQRKLAGGGGWTALDQ
ncbi:hypothetical protein [Streptomyces silvisoli]|uniref:Uncharacterized protein n=1 Tax=Streptomyces silvisoli TaxID=3034235 RepID=A0ABT5ZRI9_9ACTN|nr:hypothetical protein [Streptomyces silvisoli]MDF3292417.1 hypothetical protein [Streptomyces silvisoli]